MVSQAIRKRIFAAIALFGFAIGTVLFWNAGEFDLSQFTVNGTVAMIGLIALHLRWRKKERRAPTPEQAKDIFS